MENNTGEDGLWNTGFHFGDWLFYSKKDDNDGQSAVTDKYLLAQAFFANSVQLLQKTADVLGEKEDAAYYAGLLENVKKKFREEYLTPNGRLVSSSQTAYVVALKFDLFPENMREQAANRLVQNISRYNDHITTGFLGTPYITEVLTKTGHVDVAYKLLEQKTYPSWLYPVTMGATTIWERWDGIKPDSTFQTPNMNSFNHYAYGAIGNWMYTTIAGINPDENSPGYKHIIIKPQPGGSLLHAHASFQSMYGTIQSGWELADGILKLNVEIPSNTTATIILPQSKIENVRESGKVLDSNLEGVSSVNQQNNEVRVAVGSGKYQFTYKMGG
jgi:alpha-L-rhamnosidase